MKNESVLRGVKDILNNKKILIISNNALVESDSNGRTLGCLVENISKDLLVQICVNGNAVSSKYIMDSYAISDKMALKSIFQTKCTPRKLEVDTETAEKVKSDILIKRTSFVSLMREVVWQQAIWKVDVRSILDHFSPDVIVVQLGDCSFTLNLAYKLAKKNGIKVVLFTTEDYYFKEYNHLNSIKKDVFFDMFKWKYKKTLKKLFTVTACCVCNTPYLANLYRKEFRRKTEVVMNAANHIDVPADERNPQKIVYAGNLGLGRYQSLIKVAEEVRKVSPSCYIEVYGEFLEEINHELGKYSNIHLKGFAPYEEILRQQATAHLVLHIESFEPFYQNNLKAAFSTKIPDALASGTPFLLFAPEQLAETIYLKENDCAFVCTNHRELKTVLKQAVNDAKKRSEKINNAKHIVERNHTYRINQEIFIRAIEEAVNEDSSN
ncbi:glycosyltransferase family protein [Allofournierella sp. CML151]|uniref:glycosyltransferase family protein n=1 Tax=Allofournierella sp. CML151 TaxID=2998082 RepID=UPI0022EB32D1|nr:glycosyltransferase [Fournierella sp. CML151]